MISQRCNMSQITKNEKSSCIYAEVVSKPRKSRKAVDTYWRLDCAHLFASHGRRSTCMPVQTGKFCAVAAMRGKRSRAVAASALAVSAPLCCSTLLGAAQLHLFHDVATHGAESTRKSACAEKQFTGLKLYFPMGVCYISVMLLKVMKQ